MKKTPVLRFKGFAGEWETKKISDIAERVTRKNTELQSTLPLTISAQYGLVDQVTYFNNRVAGQNIQNYYLIKNGEFAYNKSSSDGYPWGAVKRLDNYNAGILSTLYIVFSLKNAMIDSDFLKTYFDTNHWYKHVSECAAEGARNHGLLNISAEDFLDSELALSNELEEQKEIGACFARLDAVLALARRRAERLAAVKRAMLAALFPKEGKTRPALRFQGFSGEWQRKRLGDLADIVGGGTPSTGIASYWDGDINWYSPAEIADQIFVRSSQRKITQEGYDNCSARMLPIGTVLFTSRAGIGKTAILVTEGCTNQGFQSIVPRKGKLDSYFIFARTDELKAYGECVGAGSTFVEVSGKQMADMNLMMPPTIEEQKMIGAYFRRLDEIISLQARRTEKLTALKKALLGRMFV